MTGISIRPADVSDMECILRHRTAMFREMGFTGEACLEQIRTVSEAYLREALVTGAYRGWMAVTAQGSVAGGGGVVITHWPGYPGAPEPKRAWILNIYTEPEFRRRGIARSLLQLMVQWGREQGYPFISLHASAEGRPVYESLGFVTSSEMRLKLG